MENQVAEQANTISAPSLYRLQCPKCGGNTFQILGVKGAAGKSVGISVAFGAIGNMVASSMSKDDMSYKPVNFKCSCGNKFESFPMQAQPDEILTAPCTIRFTRVSSFVGMAVSQTIWMNGLKVSPVGNGKTVEFQTMTKYNTLFVTDQYDAAFKGNYKFEAVPGGTIDVRFKRKFL